MLQFFAWQWDGSLFPFIMCLIAYEEKYVKYVVAKYPKDREEEKSEGEDDALEGDVLGDNEDIPEKGERKGMVAFVANVNDGKMK